MSRLIGEFQLSFIIFLLGQVYDGFEQWKLIICLVCNCEEVIADHAADFAMFVGKNHFKVEDGV